MASNNNNSNEQPIIRRRPLKSQRRRDGLIQYARDNTSQNGEDGIIERIFQCLPSSSSERCCVDVGAWDGKHLSNTYSLLVYNYTKDEQRWKGLLIEADPVKFQELQALHTPLHNTCLHTTISVNPSSPHQLTNILPQQNVPHNFDFLCIDIDGSDYWVLHDLLATTEYRPTLIVIEFNPTMPNDLIYIPPRSDTTRQGASLAALVELVEPFHYVLIETTLFNAFFVPRTIYQQYLQDEVKSTAIEELHEVTMGTEVYQLYDGTLKLHGCKKLLWHRVAMDEKKMQMLTPEQRGFPFAPSSSTVEEPFDRTDVVDMSAYCSSEQGDNQQQQQCGDALLNQLQQHGFVLVSGTGMSRQQCQQTLQSTQAFLSDADESVRRSCLTQDRARRGYSPMCTENFASLIGQQGLNDLVRKFRMGPETTKDASNNNNSLLQPNVWPSNTDNEAWDAAPEFQASLQSYYQAVCQAANAVVRAISDGLKRQYPELTRGLEVLSQNENHTSILTLLGYKVGTRHKGKNKSPLVAAHTDVGVVTMLLFDSPGCAQLQRATGDDDNDDGFVNVNLPSTVPQDPIFVVNIGDCLSELCQKKLPSTLHRVVADMRHKSPRHCLALFVGLDPKARLVMEGEDEMSYEEWRKRRIARAQAVLKATGEQK